MTVNRTSEEARPARLSSDTVRLVIILGALSAFGPLSIDMYLPALPSLAREFASPASQVQLTLTSCLAGLALGQLLAGPLSDALGRRRPLLIGLAAYALASALCAFAPSVYTLVGLRLIQGLAGSAGIVIARAVVRDLHSGAAAARFYSTLMVVTGLAPILAPIIGGQLLRVTSWRGVFLLLGAIGVFLLIFVAIGLPETLPTAHRRQGGLLDSLRMFRQLTTSRVFLGYALAGGLGFAAMFAYISGSPFVLQNIYGVSPQMFSLLFGINALGLAGANQINGRLVGRVPMGRLLKWGMVSMMVGGIALLAVVLTGGFGLIAIFIPLFVVVASRGFVAANTTALALSDYPKAAGSASAVLGALQFAVGAAVAPLVGIKGSHTALPMAIVIVAVCIGALLALYGLTGRHRIEYA